MAVSVDVTTNSSDTTTGTSHSFSHAGGGTLTDGFAVLGCVMRNNFTSPSATYGGNAMTQIGTTVTNGVARVAVFYIVAPSTGTNTVSISWTGNSFGRFCFRTYTGVDQTSPYNATYGTATGSSTTPSATTNSKNGDEGFNVTGVVFSAPAVTFTEGFTSISEGTVSNGSDDIQYGFQEHSITTSTWDGGWTLNNSRNWAAFSIAVQEVDTGSSKIFFFT